MADTVRKVTMTIPEIGDNTEDNCKDEKSDNTTGAYQRLQRHTIGTAPTELGETTLHATEMIDVTRAQSTTDENVSEASTFAPFTSSTQPSDVQSPMRPALFGTTHLPPTAASQTSVLTSEYRSPYNWPNYQLQPFNSTDATTAPNTKSRASLTETVTQATTTSCNGTQKLCSSIVEKEASHTDSNTTVETPIAAEFLRMPLKKPDRPAPMLSGGEDKVRAAIDADVGRRCRFWASVLMVVTVGGVVSIIEALAARKRTQFNVVIAPVAALLLAYLWQWCSVHGSALTTRLRVYFDESNLLETKPPITEADVFVPEQPTPGPTDEDYRAQAMDKQRAGPAWLGEVTEKSVGGSQKKKGVSFEEMRNRHYGGEYVTAMRALLEQQQTNADDLTIGERLLLNESAANQQIDEGDPLTSIKDTAESASTPENSPLMEQKTGVATSTSTLISDTDTITASTHSSHNDNIQQQNNK